MKILNKRNLARLSLASCLLTGSVASAETRQETLQAYMKHIEYFEGRKSIAGDEKDEGAEHKYAAVDLKCHKLPGRLVSDYERNLPELNLST